MEEFLSAAARAGVPITTGSSGTGFKQKMVCDSNGRCTIILSPL